MRTFTFRLKSVLLMCVLILTLSQDTTAQCSNDNSYFIDLSTTFDGDFAETTCIFGGEYCTATVCSGVTYIFSTCGTLWDSQITLYTSTGTYLSYNDDGCGDIYGASYLVWTSNYTGTINIVVDEYLCSDFADCAILSVSQVGECAPIGSCTNNNTLYNVNATPSGVGNTVTVDCMYGGEYVNVSVCEGASYTFSSCGAGYDTQITLFASTGEYLAYDDDGCGSFGASTLYWTAPFTGTVRVLLDEFQCATNATCTDLTVTQTSSCFGGCNISSVQGFFDSCNGDQELAEFYVNYTGGCTVESMFIYSTALGWEFIDLSAFGYTSGEPIGIYLGLDNTLYTYYFVLSDGTTSLDYFYNSGLCSTTTCQFSSTDWDYLGCSGESEYVSFYPFYTGPCTIEGMWFNTALSGWTYVDLAGQGLTSGEAIGILLGEDNTMYTYYYVLNDNTTSPDYLYFTGTCDIASCAFTGSTTSFVECFDTDEQVNFYAYYSGACSVYSIWFYTAVGGWQENVLAGAYFSGDPIGFYLTLDNTAYDYYFVLDDGTTSSTYTYFTSDCDNVAVCSNLFIDYNDTGCFNTGVNLVPSGDITAFYNGACTVAGVYTSVNGGAFNYLDLSAYGLTSGDPIGLLFNVQNADYDVYYVLDDGSASPIVSFLNPSCESGETICDCAGTQLPIEALDWLGDGSLDEGGFDWNGDPNLPVNFNCALWGFDCGDGLEPGFYTYDPYGVCSGNIPPANGCVDEFCYNVDFDILTDCYPEEVTVAVFNSVGDLVFVADNTDFLIADYTAYTFAMCLPAGCYTFAVYDSFGDGMNSDLCTDIGFAGIWDYSVGAYVSFVYGDGYTDEFFGEFCVGPQTVCDNLEMTISPENCTPTGVGSGMAPSISYVFDFAGPCTVQSLFYSVNGAAFVELDVTAENWGSGDEGFLFNLVANSDYTIYYTTNDGATSYLYDFSTGDCNDEISICDCNGTVLSIGVTAWLGDGFADNGFYQWAGQYVDFNCATWGYDCGDINGSPVNVDPYNVCEGQLPPLNGCVIFNEILGCTDPTAINFNPQATINDGSCIYDLQLGCMDPNACNYNDLAVVDNGSCEYITCAGCTDSDATNYDPTATIEDGSCIYVQIPGCTDPEAYNYNPIATQNDGSCIYECLMPVMFYEEHCSQGDLNNFYIDVEVSTLGNAGPYTITNSFNNQQMVMNGTGSFSMGPFPNGILVIIQVTSNTLDNCLMTSQSITTNCSAGGVYGCTDPEATNYNPDATIDDGSCTYISVDEVEVSQFAMYPNPARDQVTITNNGKGNSFEVRVLDTTGRLIRSEQLNIGTGNSYVLDIAALAQGNYMLEIHGKDSVEHHSLIIQK